MYAPAIFNRGHIVLPLSVRPSVLSVHNKNGFRLISFEKISVYLIQILYTGT